MAVESLPGTMCCSRCRGTQSACRPSEDRAKVGRTRCCWTQGDARWRPCLGPLRHPSGGPPSYTSHPWAPCSPFTLESMSLKHFYAAVISHELAEHHSPQESRPIGSDPAAQRTGDLLGNESPPCKLGRYYPLLSALRWVGIRFPTWLGHQEGPAPSPHQVLETSRPAGWGREWARPTCTLRARRLTCRTERC